MDLDIVKTETGYDVIYGKERIHFDYFIDAAIFADDLRREKE